MNIITRIIGTNDLEHRPGVGPTRECIQYEGVEIRPHGAIFESLEILSAPAGPEAVIADATITMQTVGRYTVRCHGVGGVYGDVELLCAEQAALDWLLDGERFGHGHSNARHTLRSICNHMPAFTGYVQSLHGVNLTPFGG